MDPDAFAAIRADLRAEFRAFLAEQILPHAADWERQGATPKEAFRRFGQRGYLGLTYPSAVGGGGQGFLAGLVMAEEFYYAGWGGLALSVLGHAGVALHPFIALGTPQQQERYLRPALQGEQIAAIAVTEPEAGSDVASLTTRAERVAGGWRLTGRKMFVSQGSQADFYLIAARTSEGSGSRGISLIVVEQGTPGLNVIRPLEKLGMRGANTAEVALEGCVVPEDALLGEEGKGFYAVMRQFQAERLILAAGALALGRRALDEGITYARQRVQFGRPISEFQALRHRIAEAAAELEAQRTFLYATARRYEAGEYPVTEIAMSKLMAARTGCRVADEMLQILAGYGYIQDYPMERIWRDVRLMRIGGGTDEIQLEIIARRLGLDAPEAKRA